ncbi:putative ATP-dependent Clp protease ATP-binding subunit ClpX [Amylocarpus encephaloides]|uniref:ATP-dependent Clp protease ATP-binding subunit ClpX n=1 Tax=Amylocarpus encephaloides TaxID=45428 RepID=A0A9P7YLV1_9HELO|nr:putative ATP-dependent Clp protease ATP-binding subunit ClpX [Amylocarpus encephaloides]
MPVINRVASSKALLSIPIQTPLSRRPISSTACRVAIYNHYQRIREIKRQETAAQKRHEQKLRREARERLSNSHPVETDWVGQPQTADLNRKPEPETEPELGSRSLKVGNHGTIIEKSNLLLLGPSGSSIERLLLAASHSILKCETGIIFFDELDKLAKPAVMTHGRDVSGEGVQQGLLKMIEGTTVTINAKTDRNSKSDAPGSSRGSDRLDRGTRESGAQQGKSEQYTIDTTNILFVFAGAFVGLEKIISKRLSSGSSLGFGASIRTIPKPTNSQNTTPPNTLSQVNTSDLQAYGLIPELLGRIPITVSLSPLSLSDLVSILHEPKNSLVKQYMALFDTFGVNLRFTTAALHAIAEQALVSTSSLNQDNSNSSPSSPSMGTGARGLRAILESLLQETMYLAPGSDIRYCLIDEQFVRQHLKKSDGRSVEVDVPSFWSRGSSSGFEDAFEREEKEWGDRGSRKEDEVEERGGFERMRVGGSSGM